MGLNVQRLLQMASNLTGVDQSRLNEAAQKASQFGQANSKADALGILKRAGVDDGFINKAKSLLNNPVARTLAGAVGIDVNQARGALDELQRGDDGGAYPTAPQNPVANSRLQSLRSGLKHLRK